MSIKPELCVGAVAVTAERLLLIRRGRPPSAGQWSLPGGRVELHETLAEAVVREVKEETGLDVLCGGMVGWVERMGSDHHYVIMDFAVTPLGALDLTPGDDADDARWVPLWEVSEVDLVDGLLDFLADHDVIDVL